MKPEIEESWKEVLINEFEQPYMKELKTFLTEQYKNYTVYPPANLIFEAFNRTPFDQVKIVVFGQDPYHGAGQAHGLAFSVQKNVAIPPSLRNIYKALKYDYETFQIPPHGNLTFWADQGVLLLNATLTVRKGEAGSHQNHGWERFTNKVVELISEKKEGVVFLLWGNPAQRKASLIDLNKHHVLTAVHPSPLSAHRGFLTCKHFSAANDLLIKQKKEPIDWQIPF